ncbi:MAG: spermidine synthase [Micavibrio sp.]
MSAIFKELAYALTPIGELSLRRRKQLSLGVDVYEIKLNEEYLMSSLFTVAEEEVARLGLAGLDLPGLDVVVGGLGLGYTARAALEHKNVKSLLVIEAIEAVIQWHQEKLLPLSEILTEDTRCRLVKGDFFTMAKDNGFDPDIVDRKFHAILLDVDHSPRLILHPSHAWFYERDGLLRLADHLYPGGVFALWSDEPPDEQFCKNLAAVFPESKAHVVTFHNPLQNREARNTVYVARTYL